MGRAETRSKPYSPSDLERACYAMANGPAFAEWISANLGGRQFRIDTTYAAHELNELRVGEGEIVDISTERLSIYAFEFGLIRLREAMAAHDAIAPKMADDLFTVAA